MPENERAEIIKSLKPLMMCIFIRAKIIMLMALSKKFIRIFLQMGETEKTPRTFQKPMFAKSLALKWFLMLVTAARYNLVLGL